MNDWLERLREATRTNILTILSGPTAVGKGTLSSYLHQNDPNVWVSISYTTRPLRAKEIEGVHYFQVDQAEFNRMIKDGEFLEWAIVHNNHYYGTPIKRLLEAVEQGAHAILEIDIQGARAIRKLLPNSRFIFLVPPNFDTLIYRQGIRDTEDYSERKLRLKNAELEMESQNEFDFVVVNDKVEEAVDELRKIIQNPDLKK
jgi:guanylate kinase